MAQRVRPAVLADTPQLVELYARAFEDNPAYASVFQLRELEPQRHREALAWLFAKRVSLALRTGAYFLVSEEGDEAHLLGAAILLRRDCKPSLLQMFAEGMLEWPFRWGLPSLLRALSLDGKPCAEPASTKPVALLQMVAVQPGRQGAGTGSSLVRALLDHWDAFGGGAVVLDTQLAANLPFYARFGFSVTAERSLDGYSDWQLMREPVSSS